MLCLIFYNAYTQVIHLNSGLLPMVIHVGYEDSDAVEKTQNLH